MKKAVLYIHGKSGNAGESEHYRPLFPDAEVIGLDYRARTPWEAGEELRSAVDELLTRVDRLTLIAVSIGAYFSLNAKLDGLVERAFLISPVVDMENLIVGMMRQLHVTEDELRARGVIPTPYGEDLSWAYLSYVKCHPIEWNVPTHILYGGRDELVIRSSVERFAAAHGASLTVMEDGEHWFHTVEQMRFLDAWIRRLNK